MKSKLIHSNGARTYALILEQDDEVMRELRDFAMRHSVKAAHFTAIGALSGATVAFFDWERRDYEPIAIEEQVEVLTLTGDVALKDREPKVHAHVVLGKRDGTAHGGHLLEGRVRPTLEVILIEVPVDLQRRRDLVSGLALIDVE